MDGWDIALLTVAGYVAVTALVRLMLKRRDQAWHELRRQVQQQKRRQQDETVEPARRRTA
jgi:hypothetical protein